MSMESNDAARAIEDLIKTRVAEEVNRLRQELSSAGVRVSSSHGSGGGSSSSVASALERLAAVKR